MPIAYRNGSGVNTGVVSTATVIPVPSGVTNGDRMYALVTSIASTPTLTGPAGWTKFDEHIIGANTKSAVFYRDVGASAEPANYTWSWSAAGRSIGLIVAYSGIDRSATQIGGVTSSPNSLDWLPLYTWAVSDTYSWAIFLAVGREEPGTDFTKDWRTNEVLDVERFDTYSPNTGSGTDITAAWFDSGRALPAGPVSRQLIMQNFNLTPVHGWALQLSGLPPVVGVGGNPMTALGIPIR
jgi:hypothetical protein